jgi:hypothetical protein
MSWSRPIFNSGLYGRANRAVVNLWTKGAIRAEDNAETFDWARREMAAGNIWDNGLVQLQTATLLAVNRWQYEFVPYYPSNQTGLSDIITTLPSHTRFSNQVAYNLREMFNTAIYADNMDLTNPPSSIGPVGSRYNAGTSSWPGSPLYAVVHLWVVFDKAGKEFPYFDRPNPIRCESAFTGGD